MHDWEAGLTKKKGGEWRINKNNKLYNIGFYHMELVQYLNLLVNLDSREPNGFISSWLEYKEFAKNKV